MLLDTPCCLVTQLFDIAAAVAVLIDARTRQTYDLRLVHLLNVEVRVQLWMTRSMCGGEAVLFEVAHRCVCRYMHVRSARHVACQQRAWQQCPLLRRRRPDEYVPLQHRHA